MPLSSKQRTLLRRACHRGDGSLSRPDGLGERAAKSLAAKLIAAGCAEPALVSDAALTGELTWEETQEGRVGLRLTGVGWTAIGLKAPQPRITKQARVLALLRRPEGTSLDALMEATGWLPHSTRAALTGLRKKGHVLVRDHGTDGATRYRLVAASLPATPEPTDASDRIEG